MKEVFAFYTITMIHQMPRQYEAFYIPIVFEMSDICAAAMQITYLKHWQIAIL